MTGQRAGMAFPPDAPARCPAVILSRAHCAVKTQAPAGRGPAQVSGTRPRSPRPTRRSEGYSFPRFFEVRMIWLTR